MAPTRASSSKTRLDFWREALDALRYHVAHSARLDNPDKDGNVPRPHYEMIRDRLEMTGQTNTADYLEVMDALTDPDFPESMDELFALSRELIGQAGYTSEGHAMPLKVTDITGFCEGMGYDKPSPLEIKALIEVDSARRFPFSKEFDEP